jgi:hypothetical protein
MDLKKRRFSMKCDIKTIIVIIGAAKMEYERRETDKAAYLASGSLSNFPIT